MSHQESKLRRVEQNVARVLFWGVVLSVVTTLVGYLLTLKKEPAAWLDTASKDQFVGLAAEFPRNLNALAQQTASLEGPSIIVSGLVILMITPLLRVLASCALFISQRDWIYTTLTLTVIFLLAISLASGITH